MADYPSRGRLLGADPVAMAIRNLAKEAEQEQYDLPGMASLAVNHPGIFSYQIKTQPHYQQDMRTASWLDKVAQLRKDTEGRDFGLELEQGVNPAFREAIDRREELQTPYWNRGPLAHGQPLREGYNWAQAVPFSMINAARTAMGVPGAEEDLSNSADMLALRIPGLIAGRPHPAQMAWEAERRFAEGRPVTDFSFVDEAKAPIRILPEAKSLPFDSFGSHYMTSGDQALGEAGVPPGWGRRLGGAAVEAALDPVSGAVGGIRALLGKRILSGAAQLGGEMALPSVGIAIEEAVKRNEKKR